ARRVRQDPLIGAIIDGRYEVDGILGRGGMGIVYEVRHTELKKRFALKVLRTDEVESTTLERFTREARALAALKHENLPDVSDFGEITDRDAPLLRGKRTLYFVMELLRGRSLGDQIREEGSVTPAFA